MSRTLLITGYSGFTGRYVARLLEQHGWEVTGLVRSSEEGNGGREVFADLLDPHGLTGVVARVRPDAVLHLAAVAFVGHGSPGDFYTNNVIGTRNLLEAVATVAESVSSIVLASSANVYGNVREGTLSEQTAMAPANDYAVSKVAMEHMAYLWRDRLPITITRPFNYTGVGQDLNFLIPKIVHHFRSRASSIELGNLEVERDFSDVRDVAEVYHRLLENTVVGETVNICSGAAQSLHEVIELAAEVTGHRLEVLVNPAFVRPNEVRTLSGDRRHLDELVGAFERVPFVRTLEWMLKS